MHKLTAALLSAYNSLTSAAARVEPIIAVKLEALHASAVTRVGNAAVKVLDAEEEALEAIKRRAQATIAAQERRVEAAEAKKQAVLKWERAELSALGR